MRTWVLTLMTVLVAFAGCLGGGDDEETGPTETANETMRDTETGSGANQTAENIPPTASISASIEQGEIPFNVTFSLDATDADGDALSWTLDADGDDAPDAEGADLPANHTFTYEAEGLYNVTFTVTDGTDEAVQTLVINATAAAAATGPVAEYSATATSTSYALKGEPNHALQCPGFVSGTNGDGCAFFAFEEDYSGFRYRVSASQGNLRIAFWDTCSPSGSGISFEEADEAPHGGSTPDGAGCIIVWNSSELAGTEVDYGVAIFA